MANDIRVNAVSIRQYAGQASSEFENARTALERMLRDAADVRYFGPNADGFKRDLTTRTTDFANQLLKQFQSIAEAVEVTTGAIAQSLGGAPVHLNLNVSPLQAPAIPPSPADIFELDTAGLDAVNASSKAQLEIVKNAIASNQRALVATDWFGDAKQAAVSAVLKATQSAQAAAEEASADITKYIAEQIRIVKSQDSASGS